MECTLIPFIVCSTTQCWAIKRCKRSRWFRKWIWISNTKRIDEIERGYIAVQYLLMWSVEFYFSGGYWEYVSPGDHTSRRYVGHKRWSDNRIWVRLKENAIQRAGRTFIPVNFRPRCRPFNQVYCPRTFFWQSGWSSPSAPATISVPWLIFTHTLTIAFPPKRRLKTPRTVLLSHLLICTVPFIKWLCFI